MRIGSFSQVKVCIIGDVMLDRYFFGEVNRISPEAPVPIVRVKKITSTLGGAANVANNVAHLNAKPVLIGVVGKDETQSQIETLAAQVGISTRFITDKHPTTTKVRVIGAHQQMLRMDFEEPFSQDPAAVALLKAAIDKQIAKCHVVVISDYGKGVISNTISKYAIAAARKQKVPVIVDPKSEDWTKYKGATFITPNIKELGMAVGRTVENEHAAVCKAARELLVKYNLAQILVTRSEKGMSLITRTTAEHIHSLAQQVFDVSGAGDTVVGSFAVALGAGMSLLDSLTVANVAAGIVVAKVGTAPVELDELVKACRDI